MAWLRVLTSRLTGIFLKDKSDGEMDEEFRFHLDQQIEENLRRGMSPEEARDAALRQFGGVMQSKETYRDQRGIPFLETLWRDVWYGLRGMWRDRAFALSAILSLAVGIGATTTIFSVMNLFVFRPLPFREPHQLVMLGEYNSKEEDKRNPTLSSALNWRQHCQSFEQMELAVAYSEPETMLGAGENERIKLQFVSGGLFSMLGVMPAWGRNFRSDDASSDTGEALIISYGFWQRHFGGNSKVLGQTVFVGRHARTIVGIMPPGFWVIPWANDIDGWVSLNLTKTWLTPETRWLNVLARLKSGVGPKQAQAEMDVFSRNIAQTEPAKNKGWQISVWPLQKFYFQGRGKILGLLLGVAVFVLLISCANVANLELARAAARNKEMALRLSLGASRYRLFQQLLTETVLLGILGGIAGALFSFGGIRFFILFSDWFSPGEKVPMDARILGFVLGISILSGILFGLVPSWKGSRADLSQSLKQGLGQKGGSSRLLSHNLLVISEIAIALVLLIGAGLMINSLARILAINPGYNPKNLLSAEINLNDSTYREILENDMKRVTPKVDSFYQQIVERLQTLPEVESAALAGIPGDPLPFRIIGASDPSKAQTTKAGFHEVTPDYFRTLQIPLLKGRSLVSRDNESAPWVVVINESLARLYFPNENPIGKQVHVKFARHSGEGLEEPQPRTIIGVVGDVQHWGLLEPPQSEMYVPDRQHAWLFPEGTGHRHLMRNIFLRTRASSPSLARALRQVVAEADKNQAVYNIMTAEQSLTTDLQFYRFYVQLLGIFSGLALFLAVTGIIGVITYSVNRRTAELGIRTALGATKGHILKLVIGQGLKLTLIGAALGIGAGLALTRLMTNMLYEVKPLDPLTFTIVPVLLIGVGLAASYFPALRASKLDPMVALRHE